MNHHHAPHHTCIDQMTTSMGCSSVCFCTLLSLAPSDVLLFAPVCTVQPLDRQLHPWLRQRPPPPPAQVGAVDGVAAAAVDQAPLMAWSGSWTRPCA